ncbi:hypothetical protein DW096_10840 [Bacteroides sp. AM07-18]|jgi:hypothetical protein|uniref:ParB/Sulfiredoxin domain-containing protein n=1 Tax=Bacteroides uniformis TaxID=820 RepID=A0A414JNX0_BACUN|nr:MULTISPECIES: hypothetical protein [Bacteroides]RGD53227.1 hypothetical protein DW096_10840 [Bacteroides sp. AM07-18]RHE59827.1 hypothetical protein DW729_10290 [Bacteroides uniformis]RJU28222.1 hypothetical protein DW995_08410 [Bacteroides sp. AM51-7]RJU76266.1 hypothetical protein DW699_11165 [Bacteroides sp. AM26-2]
MMNIADLKKKLGLEGAKEKSRKEKCEEVKRIVDYLKEHTIEPMWEMSTNYMQASPWKKLSLLNADVKTLVSESNIDTRKVVRDKYLLTPRHIRILKKWIDKELIDPPLCNYENRICILEGNHRIALCKFLEVAQIPILVPKENADILITRYGFSLIQEIVLKNTSNI